MCRLTDIFFRPLRTAYSLGRTNISQYSPVCKLAYPTMTSPIPSFRSVRRALVDNVSCLNHACQKRKCHLSNDIICGRSSSDTTVRAYLF